MKPVPPWDVALDFIDALNAGELDRAASHFARDACFVTPDATSVRGRDEIRPILGQVIGGGVRVQVGVETMISVAETTLATGPWAMHYERKGEAPFTQTSHATVLLRRLELTWKLLIVAPWGFGHRGSGQTPANSRVLA